MTKEQLTKEQLEQKKQSLEREIVALESAVTASDSHAFDLLIADIKRDMEDDIAEENWKSLKLNQKKIESYREVEKIIESQADLLEDKKEELSDVNYQLEHFQLSFDLESVDSGEGNKKTGIVIEPIGELEVGDVLTNYSFSDDNGHTKESYLVKQSAEMDGKFALISTGFDDERLLQYPATLKLLERAEYVGNIFIADDNQQLALDCLAKISENRKSEEEQES